MTTKMTPESPLSNYAALPAEAVKWLANGRRGISSNTLFSIMYGVDAIKLSSRDVPHDAGDFRRCRVMVEGIPHAREVLLGIVDAEFIAGRSARHALLSVVENWDVLCGVMDRDTPDWADPSSTCWSDRLNRSLQMLRADGEAKDYELNGNVANAATFGQDKIDTITSLRRINFTDPAETAAKVQYLMDQPVIDRSMPGNVAFDLHAKARSLVDCMVEFGDRGVAARARAALSSHNYSGAFHGVKAPKNFGPVALRSVQRDLFQVMDVLWKEGHVASLSPKKRADSQFIYLGVKHAFDAVMASPASIAAAQAALTQPKAKVSAVPELSSFDPLAASARPTSRRLRA